jgi:hypothetical protein
VVQESIRQKPVNAKINLNILRNGHLIPVELVSEQLPATDEAVTPIRPRVQPLNP